MSRRLRLRALAPLAAGFPAAAAGIEAAGCAADAQLVSAPRHRLNRQAPLGAAAQTAYLRLCNHLRLALVEAFADRAQCKNETIYLVLQLQRLRIYAQVDSLPLR